MSERKDGLPKKKGGPEKKTHCLNGHPRTPENVAPGGACRICRNTRMREYREKHPTRQTMPRSRSQESVELDLLWKDRPKTLSDADRATERSERLQEQRDARIAQREARKCRT